ncbi:MAG: hypothetical protein SGBAC_012696, partial [Bacillariaceae sp.]
MPGAHAESRGTKVAKSGKERYRRPLGTQSVVTQEEPSWLEAVARNDDEGRHGGDMDEIVIANCLEADDANLAMQLLNSMLDQIEDTGGVPEDSNSTTDAKKEGGTSNSPSDRSRMEQALRDAGFDDQAATELVDDYIRQGKLQAHQRKLTEEIDDDNQEKKKKKRGIIVCLCCLLLLIAIIIGVVFGTRGDITTAVEDVAVNDTAAPSGSSSGSPSLAPSDSPTFTQLYDPPSIEDCIAISLNRTTSAERSELDQFDFGLVIDVTLETQDDGISGSQVFTLASAIQEKLVPKVIGCPDVSRRNLLQEGPSMIRGILQAQKQRHLAVGDNLGENRFAIADAFVKGNPVQDACTETRFPEQCHRVFMDLAVFLKGPIRLLDIIVLISEAKSELQ